jgi:hypothetical protein
LPNEIKNQLRLSRKNIWGVMEKTTNGFMERVRNAIKEQNISLYQILQDQVDKIRAKPAHS